MESLQLLDWDTRFFGFPIAKVINPKASADELRSAVSQMQSRQISLAYWAADNPSEALRETALSMGGMLVDEKLTYSAKVSELPQVELPMSHLVLSYGIGMSIDDLKQLAVESGLYSRFVVDPLFPKDKARAMFEEWMVRSLDKTIADDVLVISQNSRIAGMATVVQKNDVVSIALVAVSEDFRGRKLGETLVRAAQDWCRNRGFDKILVTTQSANTPARRLYEKCNFHLSKTEHFYHFWLDTRPPRDARH